MKKTYKFYENKVVKLVHKSQYFTEIVIKL